MSVVEEKKECIRVALQELDRPTCKMSTCEAMRTLHHAIFDVMSEDASIAASYIHLTLPTTHCVHPSL